MWKQRLGKIRFSTETRARAPTPDPLTQLLAVLCQFNVNKFQTFSRG